ncbi:MAG TPA: hypothetical protein VNQ73_14290 [Ilumatobacter sp.]|nr:hypothetical protein [Ilumatobacter sp.]
MGWLDKAKQALDQAVAAGKEALGSETGSAAPSEPPTEAALAAWAAGVEADAHAMFPDDTDKAWTVERVWSHANYGLVTARPSASIGYDLVTFAYRPDTTTPQGTYVPDGAGWALLSGRDDHLPRSIPG